jgi:lysophospholipase L1-like esterase
MLSTHGVARAALAFGLLLATTPLVSAAAAQPEPTEGLAYVALGDSYAAGFGQTPETGRPVKGCGQAANDYPHRVAEQLDLRLTDVTCAGAATANIVDRPQKVGKRPAPAQSTSLGPATRVVTVTVGGNDLDFVDTMQSCLAATPTGPILTTGRSSCEASYVKNGVDQLANRITDVVSPRLKQTFATIRSDAPNAKVFVVGYPALMPDAAQTPAKGCFIASFAGTLSAFTIKDAFPYTDRDVRYLHSIEVDLDNATRAAATQAGFDFISLLAGTVAHTPCGAIPWLNGIDVDSQNSSFTLQPGALHPNRLGESYSASTVVPKIRSAFVPTASPTPVPTHSPSPSNAPSPVLWYLSLGLIIAVLIGGTVMVIRRSKPR